MNWMPLQWKRNKSIAGMKHWSNLPTTAPTKSDLQLVPDTEQQIQSKNVEKVAQEPKFSPKENVQVKILRRQSNYAQHLRCGSILCLPSFYGNDQTWFL